MCVGDILALAAAAGKFSRQSSSARFHDDSRATRVLRVSHRETDEIPSWLAVAVFGLLPVVGLVSGPSYALLIFGLASLQALYNLAIHRGLPRIDPMLLPLAFGFCVLCWAGVTWSIVPQASIRASLQITSILLAVLIFLGNRPVSEKTAGMIFEVMRLGVYVGCGLVILDLLTGHRLQSMVTGNASHALTKYNRGVDYLVVVIWPILAYCRQRREPVKTMSLVVVVAVVLLVGESSTARLAAVLAVGALVLATYWPRLVKNGLPIMVAVLAMSLPFLLRVLSKDRSLLAPYIKNSGLDRLEIWDYMSARVLEKPFFGWGLWSARSVPIRPDELSQYAWAGEHGTYPHSHWMQLWVETGFCGVAMAVLFVWIVLARMQHVAESLRPLAYANIVAALTISFLNFEFTTDSWWAALAAAAYLWTALGRLGSGGQGGKNDRPA
jgi:hypothetical protein